MATLPYKRYNLSFSSEKLTFCYSMSKTYRKSFSGKSKPSTINLSSLAGASIINHQTMKVVSNIKINGLEAKTSMEAGLSNCYINRSFAKKHSLFRLKNFVGEVT